METQLVYLSLPQGTLERLEIVAGEKGLAVEQVVQEAIDEFLERPITWTLWRADRALAAANPLLAVPAALLIYLVQQRRCVNDHRSGPGAGLNR
jgi:hypothetical protein